ncbi:MAG: hypothetical protein AAGA01_01830 [Cyanobacteria bacterium P01_E01_bin.43]
MKLKHFLPVLFAFVTLSIVLLSQPVTSQPELPQQDIFALSGWREIREIIDDDVGLTASSDLLTLAEFPSELDRSDFEFVVNPNVREMAFDSFIESLDGGYSMIDLFTDISPFEIFEETLPQLGLSANNYADSMTVFLLRLYTATHGNETEISSLAELTEAVAALQQQVINVLTYMPSNPSDMIDLQLSSDGTLLLTLYIDYLSQSDTDHRNSDFRGLFDSDETPPYSQTASRITQKLFNVDFSQLTLDERGLSR